MKSSLGLLALIVNSDMLHAASLEEPKKLQAEADAEAKTAQMEVEKNEDAIERINDKLENAELALRMANDQLQDATWILQALTEQINDRKPA